MASTIFTACGDDSFGPAVRSSACRGGFDFTGKSAATSMETEADHHKFSLKKAFYRFSLLLAS